MNFSERIRELRNYYKYTQKDMAQKLGVATITYVKYEHGENEPNYTTLLELSNIFNVSIDYLLGKSDEKDIQIYKVNVAIENIERAADLLTTNYPEYKEGVMNLLISFLKNTRYVCSVTHMDRLYIKNDILNEIEELYDIASDLYGTKYCKNIDISSDLSKMNIKASLLRRKFDEYITLILSEDYPNYIENPPSGKPEPYFKDKIKNYK